MQIYEVSFQALAKHLIDQGREDELRDVELQLEEGKSLHDRAAFIRAFAKARVEHPEFRKRFNLPPDFRNALPERGEAARRARVGSAARERGTGWAGIVFVDAARVARLAT